ncbi:hypothetical protein GE107_01365 [Cohnella sp. CFH 77786]|uniref:hypothetical protein n=1 Tax=Cohnella sp. CFH 77786 TaxID=2662265 RepID=UPI001C60F877|nr:hypothetical protein [Cohnella sp. CFH 77786]MBW5444715.1 hypothetical protein [Cohnella sp. CFH 77786]
MKKRCECGDTKKLHLRTVVYARKVNITRVPVYCCSRCGSHEVDSGVKGEIGSLIGQLGSKPAPRTIPFDQMNEWAGVLSLAMDTGKEPLEENLVARAAEERTNELLDLWLIAASLGDEIWKSELEGRLSQLRSLYIS